MSATMPNTAAAQTVATSGIGPHLRWTNAIATAADPTANDSRPPLEPVNAIPASRAAKTITRRPRRRGVCVAMTIMSATKK